MQDCGLLLTLTLLPGRLYAQHDLPEYASTLEARFTKQSWLKTLTKWRVLCRHAYCGTLCLGCHPLYAASLNMLRSCKCLVRCRRGLEKPGGAHPARQHVSCGTTGIGAFCEPLKQMT
jgi:hypothetical protein